MPGTASLDDLINLLLQNIGRSTAPFTFQLLREH